MVRIKRGDDRIGTKKGEVYKAVRYWLDPMGKVTLLERVPDGFNPNCNEYIYNIEIVKSSKKT